MPRKSHGPVRQFSETVGNNAIDAVLNAFAERTAPKRDNRHAARLRLGSRQAKCFVVRTRIKHRGGRPIRIDQIATIHTAEYRHPMRRQKRRIVANIRQSRSIDMKLGLGHLRMHSANPCIKGRLQPAVGLGCPYETGVRRNRAIVCRVKLVLHPVRNDLSTRERLEP